MLPPSPGPVHPHQAGRVEAACLCFGRQIDVAAMEAGKTTLERAFELARSGRFSTVSELKLAVAAEGYDRKQLEGGALSRQLSALIKAAVAPS